MRKTLSKITIVALVIYLMISACQKQVHVSTQEEIPQSVIDRIAQSGYSTIGVIKKDNGYVVEGDIWLSAEQLSRGAFTAKEIIFAKEEHYRITNMITGTPRTINISYPVSNYFSRALNIAINRYNALSLTLTFVRVSSGANIQMSTFYDPMDIAVYSGGPTGAGNPYPTMRFNTYYFPGTLDSNYLASMIAHEIGHAIGFRHTDFMDRSYSCGGSPYNEGTAGVGAIWISGTPTGPSARSWMLACTDGHDRPFTTADSTALVTVY